MTEPSQLRFEPKLLVEHISPHGPRASAVRGSLLLASLRLLKESGHYPRYEAMLPKEHRDTVVYALAASWLPIEALSAHYESVDRLGLSDAQQARLGEGVGTYVIDSLFARLVRTARGVGAEAGIWLGLRQVDRIWERIFQGGGAAVTQIGPKDALVEVLGMPMAGSRFFRVSHTAFMRGGIMLVAKACFAKPGIARKPSPETFAVSISWV